MSKGAVILSANPTVTGGTLGQMIEHDHDKNIIIYSAGSYVTTPGGTVSISAHAHGTPTQYGGVTVTSNSTAWSISVGNYITTAARSTHIHGSVSIGSVSSTLLTISSASSGLTIGVPAYLTTAPSLTHTHSQYAGTGTTITGGAMTLDSNGLVLDISVSGVADGFNILAAGSQTASTATTVKFENSNGLTFGMSGGSRITGSYTQSTHAHPYINTSDSSLFNTSVISTGLMPLAYSTKFATSYLSGTLLHTSYSSQWQTATLANTFWEKSASINFAGTTTAGTNVGLTVDSAGIRASVDTGGLTAAGDGVNIIAVNGTTAGTTNTVNFSNSNGISFGLDAAATRMTASHNAYSASSMISNTFLAKSEAYLRQIIVSDSTYTSGSIVITGSNNISVSYDASTIKIIGPNTHAQQTGISAIADNGGSSVSAGTLQFTNSNGVSFAFNGSTLAASIASVSAISGIAGSGASTVTNGTIQFGNLNGISFGLNGSTMTASHAAFVSSSQLTGYFAATGFTTTATAGTEVVGTVNSLGVKLGVPAYITTAANNAIAGVIISNSTYTSGSVQFENSNGFSWGSGSAEGVITASFTHPHTSYELAIGGNKTSAGAGYITITSGSLSLHGGNNITLSQDGNNITFSGANLGGAQTGISGFIVSDSTYSSGTLSFSNANGISFGNSVSGANQVITASIVAGMHYSASGTATSSGTIQFANTAGVSFGLSNDSVYATVRTDYMSSASSSVFAKTGFTSTTQAGTNISATLNTLGLSMAYPAMLTNSGAFAGLGATTTTVSGAELKVTLNTQGLYMSVPNFLTTGIATASTSVFARTGFTTSSTSGLVVTGTLNTAGLYLRMPNYITTAMLSSETLNYLNTSLSGNIFFNNSNGVSFGSTATGVNTTITASVDSGNVYFMNPDGISGSNITWGTSTSGVSTSIYLTAGGGGSGGGGVGQFTLGGNTYGSNTISGSTIQLKAGNNISFSVTANSALEIIGAPSGTLSFINTNGISWGSSSAGSNTSLTASVETAYIPLANSTKFPIIWSLSASTGGSVVAGTTTASQGSQLLLIAGSNITLSGASNGVQLVGRNVALISASNSLFSTGTAIMSGKGAGIVSYSSNEIWFSVPSGVSTATTAGTTMNITYNTAGLSIRYPKAITTAFGTGLSTSGALTASGNSDGLSFTAPALGYLYFSNIAGFSWSSSTNGVSSSMYLVTA